MTEVGVKGLMAMGIVALIINICASGASAGEDTRMNSSKNFRDGKFINTIPIRDYSIGEIIGLTWKWLFGNKEGRVPKQPLPVVKPKLFNNPASSTIQYIWLGHSSIILPCSSR